MSKAGLGGVRIAVLTLSDSVARGEQTDTSGEFIAKTVGALGGEVIARDVLPDDADRISARLRSYADELRANLVLTTGGSGVAPRDVTPEATMRVVDRLVPGLTEAARTQTGAQTPLAILSRGIAGIRGRTLIVNLPGSPKGVQEWLDVLLPVLGHALDLLSEKPREWGKPHDHKTTTST